MAYLPPNATESIVSSQFVEPLLDALGFNDLERHPQFKTGDGAKSVDFAARENSDGDIFLSSPNNPYLLVEVKGRAIASGATINLAEDTPHYKKTKHQIQQYLLAPKCKTAQWGIITNANHIQLFRRHEKVVVPATPNLLIKESNINNIISGIKTLLEKPPKALTVCIYNNKGGVGKTTTTINLAATFAKLGKKVLVVDFDPQQKDLTNSLGLQEGIVTLSNCLINPTLSVRKAIQPFQVQYKCGNKVKFDVIPSDSNLDALSHITTSIQKRAARLRDLLKPLVNDYDYILIDCPANWMFFSQSSVYSADVILIPTKHNSLTSLENAAKVIKHFIPQVKNQRGDGGPVALPIFFNGEKITDPQIEAVNTAIYKLIITIKRTKNFDLLPYYWPKYCTGDKNQTIFSIPGYAIVSNSVFYRVPAALKDITAYKYYHKLIEEYFCHG